MFFCFAKQNDLFSFIYLLFHRASKERPQCFRTTAESVTPTMCPYCVIITNRLKAMTGSVTPTVCLLCNQNCFGTMTEMYVLG